MRGPPAPRGRSPTPHRGLPEADARRLLRRHDRDGDPRPEEELESTSAAAVALFHLVTTPDAECVVVAASREQAGILFAQAGGFVRRSEWLQARVKPTMRELRSRGDSGRIRVMAADADTADGTIPTLAVVDEVARHRSAELYGTLRDGLGPRQGRLIGISTAGDDEDSPLGRMRRSAYKLPTVERDGAYRYCKSGDGAFVLHEWALAEADDREDMAVVATANPASWQTPDALRRRFESPSMTPWAWARFACGIWTPGEDSAISAKEWADCARPGLEISEGAEGVVVGIDLGWRWDTTAVVPIRRAADETIEVHPPAILTPPQDGTSLDAEEVFAAAEGMADRWPGLTFVLDPEAGGEQLAQRLDRELDAAVLTHSQKPGPMCEASQKLAEAIATRGLAHPDHQELTRHIVSAAARFIGPVWRFTKPKGKSLPIDATVALAMAVRVLQATESVPAEPRSDVEARGDAVFF
ncbi:MAG TPA: terminase large subunit [Thermoleophilaceae bacterium]|nr:terminase large subunit [Thermoleophilaceae bacterium]